MEIIKIEKLQSNSSYIFFNWPLCDKCNYKCSYCYTQNNDTWFHEKYNLVISKLKMVKRPFRICLTGGETTEHKELVEIIEQLSKNENMDKCFLFTNLSKPLTYYNTISNNKNITITASYHPEYDNRNFIIKCIELNKIRSHNFTVNVSISDNKKYWDKTKVLLNLLIQNKIDYNINILIDTPNFTSNYSNLYENFEEYFNFTDMYDEITITTEHGTKILSNHEFRKLNLNNFYGYKCNCNSFQISRNADFIKTCDNKKMSMFIKDEVFDENILCPLEKCEGDVKITYTKELI